MIEHEGVVEEISDNNLTVRILQQSACGTCSAKGYCSAAESKEKLIHITDSTEKIQVHDKVIVLGTESMGYKAVFWAYIAPLILILFTVILATTVWKLTEIQSTFVAILSLIPYYICLYLLKNKMTRNFQFTIKKTDTTNPSEI